MKHFELPLGHARDRFEFAARFPQENLFAFLATKAPNHQAHRTTRDVVCQAVWDVIRYSCPHAANQRQRTQIRVEGLLLFALLQEAGLWVVAIRENP
jgi:hypothetical protein